MWRLFCPLFLSFRERGAKRYSSPVMSGVCTEVYVPLLPTHRPNAAVTLFQGWFVEPGSGRH